MSKSFFEATRCVLLDERLLSFFFVLLLPPPILIRERDEKERHEQSFIVSFFSRVFVVSSFYGENSALKRHPKRTQRNDECTTLNKTFVSAPFPLIPLSEKKTTTTKRKRERGREFQEEKRFCDDDDGVLMRRR